MPNYGIKPSRTATGTLIACQTIAISSASATSFAAISSGTQVCVVQFRGGDIYATFDGATVPSASSAFQIYNNTARHWDANTVKGLSIIGVSGTVTGVLQEMQIYLGDTQLPDTSIAKSLNAP